MVGYAAICNVATGDRHSSQTGSDIETRSGDLYLAMSYCISVHYIIFLPASFFLLFIGFDE